MISLCGWAQQAKLVYEGRSDDARVLVVFPCMQKNGIIDGAANRLAHQGASRTVRICFIGDSFVQGTGDDACLGWTGRVCSQARRSGHDVTHYNLGVRRDTSEDIARRWRPEAYVRLPAEHPGRLVFSFGANDCAARAGAVGPRVAPARTLHVTEAILRDASGWLPTLMV